MADEPFAQVSDLEARWRPLSDSEVTVASNLLGDASDMIRERWSDAATRLAPTTLTRLVAGMVKRAMLNGTAEGVTQQSQTGGPFSLSQTYANPNQNLFFNAEDLRILEGDLGAPKVRMGWLA